MKLKNTREPTSGLPPGKVKPPKLNPLLQTHHSDESEEAGESEEAPSNPEIKEGQQNDDRIIAPDGSPGPKQDQAPLY